MQTVVETPEYLSAAKKAKMTDEERADTVEFSPSVQMLGMSFPGRVGAAKFELPVRAEESQAGIV